MMKLPLNKKMVLCINLLQGMKTDGRAMFLKDLNRKPSIEKYLLNHMQKKCMEIQLINLQKKEMDP